MRGDDGNGGGDVGGGDGDNDNGVEVGKRNTCVVVLGQRSFFIFVLQSLLFSPPLSLPPPEFCIPTATTKHHRRKQHQHTTP
jgi:hypothetical protein